MIFVFGPAFLHATLKDFVYDYDAHLDRANIKQAAVTTKAAN